MAWCLFLPYLKKKACVERIILNTPNQARHAGNKNGVARSITHGNEVVLHTLVPATPSKPTTCEPLLISTQVLYLPLATIKQNVSGSNSLIKPWNLRWFHFTNYSKVFRGGFTSSCGVKTGTGFCLYVFVRTFSKRSKGQTKTGHSKCFLLSLLFKFFGVYFFLICVGTLQRAQQQKYRAPQQFLVGVKRYFEAWKAPHILRCTKIVVIRTLKSETSM